MRILITGANGWLGRNIVKAIDKKHGQTHHLRLTEIEPFETKHDFMQVDS
jgi:nucleoside-diphosphate-sugar epimerase